MEGKKMRNLKRWGKDLYQNYIKIAETTFPNMCFISIKQNNSFTHHFQGEQSAAKGTLSAQLPEVTELVPPSSQRWWAWCPSLGGISATGHGLEVGTSPECWGQFPQGRLHLCSSNIFVCP